jgi:hypothetical protein
VKILYRLVASAALVTVDILCFASSANARTTYFPPNATIGSLPAAYNDGTIIVSAGG